MEKRNGKKKKSGNQRSKKNSKSKSNLSDQNARCACDCEATKHPLVNNCINCGKIVCLSEGPGPCFFCGNMVCYNNETLPFLNFTKEIDNESKRIPDKKMPEGSPSEILRLRDKLLEFDKDCVNQTSVIDDECDYYQASNTWLTKSQQEQWEKLASDTYEQKHKSHLQQKFNIDITGRVYTEEEDPVELFNKMNLIQANRKFDSSPTNSHCNHFQSLEGAVYINNDNLPSNVIDKKDINYVNRIQDKLFLEVSDQGVCISLHQPYASLLVRGIKRTEGRTWYTSHRGRLWIASAAKEASAEEIISVQETYRLLNNENIEFPKTYPIGCLIGCVTVTDVLSEEEYIKLYPDEKVNSPFIFICEHFMELPIKYPIKGKHKIYKLDSAIHNAALICLEKLCRQMSRNLH